MKVYFAQISFIDNDFVAKSKLIEQERLNRLQYLVDIMQQDSALKDTFAEALIEYGFEATNLVFVLDERDASIRVNFYDSKYKDTIPYSNLGYVSVPFDIVMGD